MGNCIVDTFIEISEEDFQKLGIEKGTMHLVTGEEQKGLLDTYPHAGLVSGGSVANSIIALSKLGGKGAFCGCVADDLCGNHYLKEFKDLSIEFDEKPIAKGSTGSCVAIITPDAERTMRTSLGVANSFSGGQVNEQRIAESSWLFLEGYLFSNPDGGGKEVFTAIEYAKKHNTQIALTCSESWVVESFADNIAKAISSCSLVFCNESEGKALAKKDNVDDAFRALKSISDSVVMTLGQEGVLVYDQGSELHIPAYPTKPIDLTGAGDMFAGTYLYCKTQGKDPAESGETANFLASKVIEQIGARLTTDPKQLLSQRSSVQSNQSCSL